MLGGLASGATSSTCRHLERHGVLAASISTLWVSESCCAHGGSCTREAAAAPSLEPARKLGNLLHMVGDTYSASHVQRAAPEGSPENCGTEKIEWHFSMDLVSWKLHRAADEQHRDWRFRCLVRHAASLMKLWAEGRAAVVGETERTAKLERANEQVGKALRMLCERVLREDAEVLQHPAGGAAAGYSIASGTDRWKLLSGEPASRRQDRPIQPVGLTGPEEAREFYRSVDVVLRARGGPVRFWYPPRDMPDLCLALARPGPLPAALQCRLEEIDWAMGGQKEVESMWIPARQAAGLVAALAPAAPPVVAAPLVSATLADAAFVAGRWLSEDGGVRSEEVWTEPAGDGMLGMWRLVATGETRVQELLSIRAEDGTLVLRLRHFDASLVGREERDRPLALPLVRKADGMLRFEGARLDGGAGPVALTYARRGDALEVTLEKDGSPQPFTFRRIE